MGNCTSRPSAPYQSNNGNNSNPIRNANESSADTNFSSSQLSANDRIRWNIIFNERNQNIVDPADMHTILESTISNTINKLQSAEMTLILRRIRKVVGTFHNNVQSLPKRKSPLDAAAAKSVSVYQKDHLLDKNVMKSVFIAGDRWLSRGRDEDWTTKSFDLYLSKHGGDVSSTSDDDRHANGNGDGNGNKRTNTNTRIKGSNGYSYGNGSSHSSGSHSTKVKEDTGDLIGSAYTLLLHLSETRWDHIQTIAKESAKRVGLVLDVNEQIKLQKPVHAKGSPPPPSPINPSAEYEIQPPPANPNGVSLQALTYLIAFSLRSNRKQRLVLLFHLLLGSKKLERILRDHPAGGIPSWILECDQDWNLSYASLSHDYHYNNSIQINAMTAIETVGILLHCTPPTMNQSDGTGALSGIGSSSSGENGNTSHAHGRSTGNRKRALSYGETKYNAAKMHTMLSGYLRQVRSGNDVPVIENEKEQSWRWSMLDTFWGASSQFYRNRKEEANGDGKIPLSWSLNKFISWADEAISDDAALDIIMHQLFGMGLLPTPAMERKLVADSWVDWQIREMIRCEAGGNEYSDTLSMMTSGIMNLLSFSRSETDLSLSSSSVQLQEINYDMDGSAVWGGIGGFDGRGGLGKGIMYCIDKSWWDRWAAFVGWEWNRDEHNLTTRSREKPHDLSSERLLDRTSHVSGGSMGSYEMMKKSLKKDVDYVLVPPCVWDILYELYAGGPPLPRMIITRPVDISTASAENSTLERFDKPVKIPKLLQVETHPWVIECHVCDPHQPYRRGDLGPMSIRLMTTATQPVWRLFAEIVLRLPIVHPAGKDASGKGLGRLWKIVDDDNSTDSSEGPSRYGPWDLLLKGKSAEFPVGENLNLDYDAYAAFVQSWEEYAKLASVKSVGLKDGSRLMFEYSLHAKDGTITWPREAAVKAGLKQRDSEDDIEFRRMLRGLGPDGYLIDDVKKIIGTVVDAMDSAGRWYQAEIADIDCNKNSADDYDTSSESEDGKDGYDAERPGEIRAVKIDFRDIGGHEEWILIGSDRLGVRDRFTLDSMKSIRLEEIDNNANGKSNGESKLGFVLRRHTTKAPIPFQLSNNVCPFPGFGACGLTNLGNTCYSNSAMQCISYLPLLRSYLLSGQFSKYGDINKDNPLGTGGKLLEEVASLQQLIWSGKNGVRSPLKFRLQLGKAMQQYAGAEQQDAQELLNDLLDSLHEDSNKVIDKPYVEGLEDEWVENSDLGRVGEESWRRYLRRNRSIISNIGMGQVLNRVTCLTCNYTNSKFDPFNMLSIPFPTVSDVVFNCQLLRRASPYNCPNSLGQKTEKRNLCGTNSPSEELITEEHTITVSRLDDMTDLKQKLSELSGISLDSLTWFSLADDAERKGSKTVNLIPFPEKEGPCLSLARPTSPGDLIFPSDVPTTVVVFESTLESRSAVVGDEDDGDESKYDLASKGNMYVEIARENLKYYGDANECRLFDTDPSHLAKTSSHSKFPQSTKDLVPGLRVDGIDHRGSWFPGTVVEVTGGSNGEQSAVSTEPGDKQAKFKVHFDHFSSKWDLTYSFADFTKGNIQPLYSRSGSKYKLLKFQVFHSAINDPNEYFAYPFTVVCYPDWSVARAGAHILAQAARYLESSSFKDAEMNKICRETRYSVSKAIDFLVEADRDFVQESFFSNANDDEFDGSSIIKALEKRIHAILSKLPFEIFVCDTKQTLEDEIEGYRVYDYRLDRTIGNLMNARHGITLRWKKFGRSSSNLFSDVFKNLSEQDKPASKRNEPEVGDEKARYTNGGMRLGVCLDEFCKEQNLGEDCCWRCPKCEDFRDGQQSMALWRLPDLLTFHLKRFNCSARWREKITTKINFPLTGLNMREWCDEYSPHMSDASCIYDLVGVVHHYGGMTGGHYVANCKVTACSPEGNEEIEHNFNGAGVHAFGTKEKVSQTAGWKRGRNNKEKDPANLHTKAALSAAKTAAESSEPLWLQFDDDSVEPIPPRIVNAESAYVLFYRRRQISPSNISKYSAMD